LDPSFGDGGIVLTDVGKREREPTILATDDGLTIAFRTGLNSGGLVRYRADGSLDTVFDGDGVLSIRHRYAAGLIADPSGKLLVLYGRSLERLLPDGTLDPAFGAGGVQSLKPGFYGRGMLVPDGRILLIGGTLNGDLAILRIGPQGEPDSTFGQDGRVVIDLGTQNDGGVGIAALPDGRLLALAARTSFPQGECCATSGSFVRLEADGSLDPTFGNEGKVFWRFTVGNPSGWDPLGMRLAPDGDIVVFAGQSGSYGCPTTGHARAGFIVRFDGDGTLDRQFGTNGHVGVPMIEPQAFALQDDGRIIVAGGYADTCQAGLNLAAIRLMADGSLDTGFGDGGLASTSIPGHESVAFSISIQSDGNIDLVAQEVSGRIRGRELVVVRLLGS
jgi:uncharacterized delta-60 repeat protein